VSQHAHGALTGSRRRRCSMHTVRRPRGLGGLQRAHCDLATCTSCVDFVASQACNSHSAVDPGASARLQHAHRASTGPPRRPATCTSCVDRTASQTCNMHIARRPDHLADLQHAHSASTGPPRRPATCTSCVDRAASQICNMHIVHHRACSVSRPSRMREARRVSGQALPVHAMLWQLYAVIRSGV
jgi:hypothetical protein